MKERPLLMTPDNGQKSHDGIKTETRRIVKDINPAYLEGNPTGEQIHNAMRCPYGEVGDRLYIKEACWIYGRWIPKGRRGNKERWAFEIGPTGRQCRFDKPLQTTIRRKGEHGWGWVRRPGIFMPRWACRTVLEITEIRVQRVQDIAELDCEAELGRAPYSMGDAAYNEFKQLWISINGADSWDANPWVWAISFRKVQP